MTTFKAGDPVRVLPLTSHRPGHVGEVIESFDITTIVRFADEEEGEFYAASLVKAEPTND